MVYILYWKSGGSSLAAVGSLINGDRWFAPINWVAGNAGGIASTDWHMVKNVYYFDNITY